MRSTYVSDRAGLALAKVGLLTQPYRKHRRNNLSAHEEEKDVRGRSPRPLLGIDTARAEEQKPLYVYSHARICLCVAVRTCMRSPLCRRPFLCWQS
jgi:hypothetical protein